MRVLHVIPALASRYGGPSQAVLGFCRSLDAVGCETLIATTNADGPAELDVPIGEVTRYAGQKAIFFPRRGEGFKYSAGLARWLDGRMNEFDITHVHAVFSHSSLAAGRAGRRHGVPYVLRPLGSLDPWALARRAWKKRWLLRAGGNALINGAAAMHFMTEGERRLAGAAAGRVPSAVIPAGVAERYLADPVAAPARRAREVLVLARLHPVKRIEAVIGAFHAVASRHEAIGWHLTIAGDGEAAYRARLEERAAAGAGAAGIRFVGWLDEEAKRQALDRAAIFVLPSFQENFGAGLVEALARGVPAIVSTGVNLSPELEAAGAGWVVGLDDAELERALADAMGDAGDRDRRGRRARALASRFTWAEAGGSLAALYDSLRPAAVGGRR